MKNRRQSIVIIGCVIGMVLIAAISVAAMYPMRNGANLKPFHGCDVDNQVAFMEQYGDVTMHYLTMIWPTQGGGKLDRSEWTVKFRSSEKSGLDLKVSRDNKNLCSALNDVYDVVSQIAPLKAVR